MTQVEVAIVGAGVVGCATALALARRGVAVALLEAEDEAGLAASGTNSGILHTGFDSVPGEDETVLILRSAVLREPLLAALGLPLLRCGALLRPREPGERDTVAALAAGAKRNGVEVRLREDGALEVPGETVTDPVAYTLALAAAAERHGAALRTGFRVDAVQRTGAGFVVEDEGGERMSARVLVNCAGLHGDAVARLAGDDSFGIYPRKGEFLVFDPDGERLERILLPVPTKRTKGVLVFPTVDGRVIAGPTAVDGEDKDDWSVRPEARDEILPKAVAMWPALDGVEPLASYAGLRPAGRDGVNYLVEPSSASPGLVNVAAIRSTGLSASLGIADCVSAIVRQLGVRLGAEQPLEPGAAAAPEGAMVAAHRASAGGRVTLLLGIDEGTSAVKAILFDEQLRPLREARREKALHQPRPGWDEQAPDEVLDAVVGAVAELLDDAPGEVAACGFDHQGESVLAWDADSGHALTPVVTWQDKRSQEVLDRLERDGHSDEVTKLSGLPLDPYFSAGKLAWLLEHDEGVARARDQGTLRLGTVDSFVCDRLGAGFATDPATASRTQLGAPRWEPRLLELFGVPEEALPQIADTAGELGTLRHDSWPQELPLRARCPDQQAALAGAGCVEPGLTKATYGTGVFVLANVGAERPAPVGGLLPTIAWSVAGEVEWALDGGVFTAGALLDWLSRDLGLAADAPALAALASGVEDSGGVRVLPALAGMGAPWWRPAARGVVAGLTSGVRPAHVVRAALEAIAWRVADIVEAVRGQAPVESLRVDGGLTRDPLLLQLQADAAGVPVQRGAVDATAAGAAALAAVGAGIWPSTAAIAERIPAGERVEPQRGDAWRRDAHAAWREFVQRAAELT